MGLLLKTDSSPAYINAQDNHGDSALHLAHRHGKYNVVTLLKSKNASKKITNKVSTYSTTNYNCVVGFAVIIFLIILLSHG